MAKAPQHFIVILCGGSGPRLWPLSRSAKPKQFLKIFSDNSLLKETVIRARRLVDRDHIFIITNHKYLPLIKQDLKSLIDSKHIIVEPEKKNTAIAILYSTAVIASIDPEAVITTFTADHFISRLTLFDKNVRQAYNLASKNKSIVTLGIRPSSPSTSYGYIQTQKNNSEKVIKFIEKPDISTASKLISSESNYWNSGIYTFSATTIVNEFYLHAKVLATLYQKAFENISNSKVINKIYSIAPTVSIDVAISEKSNNLLMVPAEFVWNDVGEWKSIQNQLSSVANKNSCLNQDTLFLEVGSQHCLISGEKDKLIGLVNVKDLAIIDTPDALLVCNLKDDGSYKIRDLVAKIVQDKKTARYFLENYDKRKLK
jgi:mannose-1-phosphate guanylyltransferase